MVHDYSSFIENVNYSTCFVFSWYFLEFSKIWKKNIKNQTLPAFISEKDGKTKTNKIWGGKLVSVDLKLNASIKKRDLEANKNQ